MTLYDVCNDYSLDPAEDQSIPGKEYKATPWGNGTAYYHKKFNELHYYLGEDGLSGLSVYSAKEP